MKASGWAGFGADVTYRLASRLVRVSFLCDGLRRYITVQCSIVLSGPYTSLSVIVQNIINKVKHSPIVKAA